MMWGEVRRMQKKWLTRNKGWESCIWNRQVLNRTRLKRRGRHTADRKMLSTENHRTPVCCKLVCAKWNPMWCHCGHSVRNRDGALFVNVNHHCILLWRMSSWMQHTGRYIWWVEGSGFFYCLLLSVRLMVVFILTNGIMLRQSVSSCSLASYRRAPSSVASFP